MCWGCCGLLDTREHSLSIQFTANKKKKKSRISIRRYRYTQRTHETELDLVSHTCSMERYVWNECIPHQATHATCNRQMSDPKQSQRERQSVSGSPRYICISLPQSCLSSRCRILIRFRISATAPRNHSAKPENRNGTKREMKWNVAVASSRASSLCMPSGNLSIKCPNVVVFNINCLYN